MMNQQPDKFFRDKLEQFSQPAPSSAWSKVDSNLNKKNDKALWLKIAASLLLIGVASYVLLPVRSETSSNQLAGTNKPSPTSNEEVKASETKAADSVKEQETKAGLQKDSIMTNEKVADVPASNTQKVLPLIKEKRVRKNPIVAPVAEEQQEVLIAENNSDSNTIASPVEPEPLETITIAPTESLLAEVEEKDDRVTIVMSADEVDNKYLDKKSLAEATSGDKKPSTLRKLLDKAYDLKNNEDPFGDLRQKKNEILALNFRSDKQRSENK